MGWPWVQGINCLKFALIIHTIPEECLVMLHGMGNTIIIIGYSAKDSNKVRIYLYIYNIIIYIIIIIVVSSVCTCMYHIYIYIYIENDIICLHV